MTINPKDSRKFIAGNWKMNPTTEAVELARAISEKASENAAEIAIFPPACYLSSISEAVGSRITIGAQDCHSEDSGAFTGGLSAPMLKDCGAKMVILGHSERRHGLGETSDLVARKVGAAVRAGLKPIICVGETLQARQEGQTQSVLTTQLSESLPKILNGHAFIVSYEPVWAIGTGLSANSEQICEAIDIVQSILAAYDRSPDRRILYGGSVNKGNAASVLSLEAVGGVLVGGAALKSADFLEIAASAP